MRLNEQVRRVAEEVTTARGSTRSHCGRHGRVRCMPCDTRKPQAANTTEASKVRQGTQTNANNEARDANSKQVTDAD